MDSADQGLSRLLRMLTDNDCEERRNAVRMLGRLRGPMAISTLVQVLENEESAGVLEAAAKALSDIGEASVPGLVRALARSHGQSREFITRTLAEIGAPAVPELSRGLREARAEDRMAIVEALAAVGPSASHCLTQLLGDGDQAVQSSATGALGRMGYSAVPRLSTALESRNETVRLNAVAALGLIGPAQDERLTDLQPHDGSSPPALIALAQAAQDASPRVRAAAAHALRCFGAQASTLLCLLSQDRDEDVRRATQGIIDGGGACASDPLPTLVNALRDTEAARKNALDALERLGRAAVPALSDAMNSPDAHVRSAVAWTLGRMGTKAGTAWESLARALEDPDADVRRASAWALGRIGAEARKAAPALVRALEDPSADVRSAVSTALRTVCK